VAQARLSVRKIREVLRLKSEARLSDRQIAAVLGSARSTVQECLRRARTAGLLWPLPDLDDDELHERLYPRTRAAPRYPTPDFEAMQRELASKGDAQASVAGVQGGPCGWLSVQRLLPGLRGLARPAGRGHALRARAR